MSNLAPDAAFLNDLRAITDAQIMFDRGEGVAGGYAIYGVEGPVVDALRAVAKRYNMRLSHYRAQRAVWIARKGASFDR
jgi:hypothetical protein